MFIRGYRLCEKMNKEKIKKILKEVKTGKLRVEDALKKFRDFPYDDIGFTKIDSHRGLRCGFPEVIFCRGKSLSQIAAIAKEMRAVRPFLATRADKKVYQTIKKIIPEALFYETARIVAAVDRKRKLSRKTILVITAGTADIPVAEEAAVTAEIMGNKTERLYDVGVAGVHRLLDNKEKIFQANVIIVAAGMEGALPSVVGGITDKPVIAVPTSIGYGASFKGVAALLTMLNSCAPGVTVVNIDNGFGAGYFAGLINK